ncbi:MAG: hypothetical protein HZA78_05250 [Candidatus Schekmanbacteria bacterium]|nr:hypothetical protein [Candidatus Schekmanbacteria bacterium]
MEPAVKILLVLISMGCLIWPFLPQKKGQAQAADPQDASKHKFLQQKELTYAALKELDFDYNMGKLSEEDYRLLTQQYKQKAAGILQSIDQLEKSAAKGQASA